MIVQPLKGQGIIDGISDGIINHLIDTSEGQSGSPLMTFINGTYVAIGIHFSFIASKTLRMNYAI